MLVRRVPNAMGLRTDVERGEAAEEAVHDSAAIWGLPDFIYRGRVVAVGSGAREGGDNLVVVGDVGVVVQVKSRAAPGGAIERDRRWIEKNVQTALDQARGSIRRLRSRKIPGSRRPLSVGTATPGTQSDGRGVQPVHVPAGLHTS